MKTTDRGPRQSRVRQLVATLITVQVDRYNILYLSTCILHLLPKCEMSMIIVK